MSTTTRSATAKRRTILFAVAAGALALGAAAPASASSSDSRSVKKHGDRITITCDARGTKVEADARGEISASGKAYGEKSVPARLACGEAVKAIEVIEASEAIKGIKPIKVTEGAGIGTAPGPGKGCETLVVGKEAGDKAVPALPGKHGESALRIKDAKDGKPIIVKPAKPIEIVKPGKPAKPGTVCTTVVIKDGKRVAKPSGEIMDARR
ncbi:hypothetical protein [Streptomyces coffeae]|uniref:Tat pathway signal sequence domain protein n=1 Tax=Streptomyces coffeae TaxID=621382 RepID=A0ABS1NDX6_9ACTN|nr:hypothetical protein [Streptomyces coffeae]MBL1098284.1 hypothetical protein [Streptomyces coffeae]